MGAAADMSHDIRAFMKKNESNLTTSMTNGKPPTHK